MVHIFTNTWYLFCFVVLGWVSVCGWGYNGHINRYEVVSYFLFCISLMIRNVGHLFIYPLAICMSSLAKYLFKSLAYFVNGLFNFLLLSSRSFWYILEINQLPDKLFANIFYHYIGCLFSVDCFLCCAETSSFDVVPLVYSCFVAHAFGVTSKKPLLRSVSWRFSSVFF